MAETNRTVVALVAIIAVVLIVSLFSWGGMMGSWGWTNMGGGMMGGWGSNANPGRSVLMIGFWVLVAVGIGGIILWAIRKPGAH
ncbi:MAG: hypothetical protein H0U60_12875 [Blastocatellia bacterium]|nr:hypothetical protein [Blastocatellia bacterium]